MIRTGTAMVDRTSPGLSPREGRPRRPRSRGSPLPVICAPPASGGMAAYARENDMGCRCAPRRSGRAHRQGGRKAGGAQMSCALRSRASGPQGPLGRGGSDPAVRGPAAGSGPGAFAHPPAPPPRVAPRPAIPAREGGSSAASRRRTTRSPTDWPWGCSASARKTGTSPSRIAVWPSRTGLLDRERPQAGVGWHAHSNHRRAV